MIDNAKERIATTLVEIDRLIQSDFPSQHTKDAIVILKNRFLRQAASLGKIGTATPITVSQTECSASLELLFVYVPILGFILRSTNVRNGFEAYGPLLHLAKLLLGPNKKLIVSSEWEFSPYVYPSITELPDFVLIGLPATESSNPLVIPLAGHELGHSVWDIEKFKDHFSNRIRQEVLNEIKNNEWDKYKTLFPKYENIDIDEDMFGQLTWQPAWQWALLQSEEIFCDFLGIRLFADSYLHAFAYLVAPGTPGQRSLRYPNIKRRISHMIEAANFFNVNVPKHFDGSFMPETEPIEPTIEFLVSIADKVSTSFTSELLKKAESFANDKNAPKLKTERVDKIVIQFREWIVPTPEPEDLVDISCAGWKCSLDENLWDNIKQIKREDWRRILHDLMFKSMEVSELHERLDEAAKSRKSL